QFDVVRSTGADGIGAPVAKEFTLGDDARAIANADPSAVILLGIARIAEGGPGGVQLVGIGHLGAVVLSVGHSVAVHIRVANVADAIVIDVALVRVGVIGQLSTASGTPSWSRSPPLQSSRQLAL